MIGCMETDKPLISILMAVYEPQIEWLRKQLLSLNAQTYPNLRLYVCDDCSSAVSFEEIQSCIKDCIFAFPVTISRNEKNLGSNKTFEQLTSEAEGEYFAYCDQDDVWLPEKLEQLQTILFKQKAVLACSDVFVIDGKGEVQAKSITQVRPHHNFLSGDFLTDSLIYRNFVIGCTMLIDASVAKQACPFPQTMVHDHFLAFYASTKGKIVTNPKPLIYYRIHGENQTGSLAKVVTKQDYYNTQILRFCQRINDLRERFPITELCRAEQWARARKKNYYREPGGISDLWRYRKVDLQRSGFEIIALRLPDVLFIFLVRLIQRGKI